jgi:hypothetical protein
MPKKRKPVVVPPKRESFDTADEVSSLRDEVVALHDTVTKGFQEIKSSLADILRVLEEKGDH